MFFVIYLLVALSNFNCMVYNPEIDSLLALKNDLAIYLKQVIKDDYFRDIFCDSPFFSYIYRYNSQYIIAFLEQLPLRDILIQCNFNEVEFKKIILNNLVNDLQEKRTKYQQILFFLPVIVTLIKTLTITLEYEQIKDAIITFHTPLENATEFSQIITENSYKYLRQLELQRDFLHEHLFFGITFAFVFEDTSKIIITYTYKKIPMVVLVCDYGPDGIRYKVLSLAFFKQFI